MVRDREHAHKARLLVTEFCWSQLCLLTTTTLPCPTHPSPPSLLWPSYTLPCPVPTNTHCGTLPAPSRSTPPHPIPLHLTPPCPTPPHPTKSHSTPPRPALPHPTPSHSTSPHPSPPRPGTHCTARRTWLLLLPCSPLQGTAHTSSVQEKHNVTASATEVKQEANVQPLTTGACAGPIHTQVHAFPMHLGAHPARRTLERADPKDLTCAN